MNSCRSISVVIRVPKREDGIDLLVVETSGRHLRLADLPIVVGIKLSEGRLDFLKSLESLAHPCDNSGCGWTHDSDKFRYINFTIIVDVSQGKDGINFLGRELLSTVPHLLLADHSIPVLVKNSEKLLSLVDVPDCLGHHGNSSCGTWAHQTDELFQVNLRITVDVSQDENCINFLVVELATLGHFRAADFAVLVDIDLQEGLLDIIDVAEL